MIMDAAEISVEMKYEPAREGDVRYSVADISKAKSELGYKPEWELTDGIKETVEYFKEP